MSVYNLSQYLSLSLFYLLCIWCLFLLLQTFAIDIRIKLWLDLTWLETNPAHNVRITITLFLTYLLRPVPRNVQLFIQAVHFVKFFDCIGRLGKADEQGWIGRKATDWRTLCRKFLPPVAKECGAGNAGAAPGLEYQTNLLRLQVLGPAVTHILHQKFTRKCHF